LGFGASHVAGGLRGQRATGGHPADRRLVRIMQEAFAGIWQVSQEHKLSLRTATFIVACQRILHAREMRGLYP
ncbi:hypothetical protein ACQKEU_14215, partial [Acidovorax sp. NPDC077664]